METFRELNVTVKTLSAKISVKSERMSQLTGDLFPDYIPILDEFAEMITWKNAGGHKVPEPKLGLDPEFDACNDQVEQAKTDLDEYLEDVKKILSKEAKYNYSSKKFRYEIELPGKVEVDDDNFVLTSKVQGKNRYQTDELRDLISSLEEKEEILNQALAPFIRGIFGRFYKYR